MKEEIINGIKYRLNGGTLTAEVIKKNEGCEGEIIIPKTVVFNELTYRVTSIGEDAFEDCDGLTSIVIPEGVKSIGANAFSGTSLAAVVIPDSMMSIGERVFEDCCDLASVVIPDSVQSIGKYAFHRCTSLESVRIPDSVKIIGASAFSDCSSLTSITLPNSVTTIGEYAFQRCEKLTSVAIPSSVTSIGQGGTFQGCTSLKSVQWNAINCTIDQNSDGRYCPPFADLSSIRNFTFGNNVKFIPTFLCYGLNNLTSIYLPDGITSIGAGAFKNCSMLKALDIPNSVMLIEKIAFSGCKSLKIIAIPSSVMIIENGAFGGYELEVIRYGGTVEQCKARYRYWDQMFHGQCISCTDGDVTVYF